MENFKEINLNNNYIFLDDNDNLERIIDEETRHSNCDEFNLSAFSESSNISTISIVLSQVKSACDNNIVFKIIFFLAYCNPFVKLLINIYYNYYNNVPNCFNIENILCKKERKIVSFITIIFLLLTNLFLIFGNVCDENYLRISLFFVNNFYLFYFLIALVERNFEKRERDNSWDGLINILDRI